MERREPHGILQLKKNKEESDPSATTETVLTVTKVQIKSHSNGVIRKEGNLASNAPAILC